ncbi:N-acetylglucosamine kinase [Plantibacter sp. VKM Ac-2880]|uniref:N-acetylglucosamine kinase n=1 Tax=Plantibacter sp. VKM Ac-2880 TaxID=2783827 RepID=UPI00188DFEED|nr:BadF/BadG/BcrA/BcrD ATPase family protein [Plantibacter sp. VKM Ac-2880]MBF4568812.1 N-acetylglucosamine kinase [Plantibacter sp. VKM Ac-2880]
MKTTLAVDAGGTSSRAALVDASARRLGSGRAGGGNPTSSGVDAAATQIALAARAALDQAGNTPGGPAVAAGSPVVITQAGLVSDAYRRALDAHLRPLGLGPVVIEPDLLGMYGSGSASPDGIVLVAGTGSVAGRIRDRRVVREVGGAGWLLGDGGSGFWIARRVVRAVAADLDDIGPRTALTPLLCQMIGTTPETTSDQAHRRRSSALDALIRSVNDGPPIAIARLAPLAFLAIDDEVALAILDAAVDRLALLVERVTGLDSDDRDATLVVGGSVLVNGLLPAVCSARERLSAAAAGARLVPVADGLVGAAALGLRMLGEDVDDATLGRLRRDLAAGATR